MVRLCIVSKHAFACVLCPFAKHVELNSSFMSSYGIKVKCLVFQSKNENTFELLVSLAI